jgi:Asp-tRNA(Asn)/Glu-tRNA(Gln) amidotransferase C subunit
MSNNLPISEQVNVWREDVIDEKSMLTQAEALEGAEASYEGYFQVPLVVDKESYE